MTKFRHARTDSIYKELFEEALNQGFFKEEAKIHADKIYHYANYDLIRDALDWGLCLEELLHWLILRSLFAVSEETVTKNMAARGLDFTLTGFDILTKDVELYEEIVSPYVGMDVLEAIAKDLNIRITAEGFKNIEFFEVPVQWTMIGTVGVKAANLDEAIEMVNDDRDHNGRAFGLPTDSYYLKDSFKVSDPKRFIKDYFCD